MAYVRSGSVGRMLCPGLQIPLCAECESRWSAQVVPVDFRIDDSGRDFRLTDVYGRVAKEILA